MHLLYQFQQFLEGHMEVLLCEEHVNDLRHSPFHLFNCLITTASELSGITKRHRKQGLDNRKAEELCWCPSWSNSLWQGWSCWLVHCPGGNTTDPMWRVLASSDRISSWTPLKPQHSNPNPNPFGQSTLVYWLPYSSHTSHHPSQTPCLPWISYASQKLMFDSCKMVEKQPEAFHTFLWHFLQV